MQLAPSFLLSNNRGHRCDATPLFALYAPVCVPLFWVVRPKAREIGGKAEMPESVSLFVSLCPSHPLPLACCAVVGDVAGHHVAPGGLSRRLAVEFSLCFLVEVLKFAKVT